MTRMNKGFSLVELLLVLAIIGILSGIAIPSFLGQRRRARLIGDAKTNAKSMAMALENRRAETGLYPAAGTWTWTAAAGFTGGPDVNPIPTFTTQNNTQMDYSLTVPHPSDPVATSRLTYLVTVTDPKLGNGTVLKMDQTGAFDPTVQYVP